MNITTNIYQPGHLTYDNDTPDNDSPPPAGEDEPEAPVLKHPEMLGVFCPDGVTN